MKKLLLVGAILFAASSSVDAGEPWSRVLWLVDCTPTYETEDAGPKTKMVRLALEFISPNGKDHWQLRQYHAYHIFDNGQQVDLTYWLFDRVLTIIYAPQNSVYMWRGKTSDLAQPTNKTAHKEVFGNLSTRDDGTYFYFEAYGDDPLTATDSLKSECVVVDRTQEEDK
jgi:hypothetical protein